MYNTMYLLKIIAVAVWCLVLVGLAKSSPGIAHTEQRRLFESYNRTATHEDTIAAASAGAEGFVAGKPSGATAGAPVATPDAAPNRASADNELLLEDDVVPDGDVLLGPNIFPKRPEDDEVVTGAVFGASPCKSVYEVLIAQGLFTFKDLLRDGLGDDVSVILNPRAIMTVFAPTEAAFAEAGWAATDSSFSPLSALARNHLILNSLVDTNTVSSSPAGTVTVAADSGASLRITANAAGIGSIAAPHSSARIVRADTQACVSRVYVIDALLQ